MSRLFAWRSRSVEPIGLDIGARQVRMIQVARHHTQIAAIACQQRALPAGPLSHEERRKLQAAAIADMLDDGNFVGRDIITALPWADLQIRPLRFPPAPNEELNHLVQAESADRLGLDPSEAEVRFINSGDVRQGTQILQEVIALTTTREAVESQLAFLDELGLRPVAMDSGPCAVFRSFERFLKRDDDARQVNAFVDLGYGGSRVVVARGRELVFIKTIPIGGQRFEGLVSDRLDLTIEETVAIRDRLQRSHGAGISGAATAVDPEQTVGANTHHAVLEAIRPALQQLAKEISLCLRYCSVTFRGLRSDTMTAIGGESLSPGVLRVLSDHAGIPFHLGQPMRQISAEAHLDGANRRGGQPEWATAIGLALKPVHDLAEVTA